MAATAGLCAIRIKARFEVTALPAFPWMAHQLTGRDTVFTAKIRKELTTGIRSHRWTHASYV